MAKQLHVEARGDVAVVRIDRPPANAMDPGLLQEGIAVISELARDEPAAVVLAGREGYFSAGADLKIVPTLDADGQRAMVEGINGAFAAWYGFPRPVVCAVTGHAIAGGLILALCGDHRVCSTEGKLGLTELRAGVPYPAVALAIVRAELSPPVARALVLRAHLVDPAEALALGVVDELAEPDAVEARAVEVAQGLAELPGETYGAVKRQLRAETIALADEVVAGGREPLLADGWTSAETAEAAGRTLRGV